MKAEQLNIHIMDTIKVQWAFQGKANSPKNIRVLRVLEFNGDALSEPLGDNALSAVLDTFSEIGTDQGAFSQAEGVVMSSGHHSTINTMSVRSVS